MHQTVLGHNLDRIIPGSMELVSNAIEAVESLSNTTIDPKTIQVIGDLERIVNVAINKVAEQTKQDEETVHSLFLEEYYKCVQKNNKKNE